MSRDIVTIMINGVGLVQFGADKFDLDVGEDTVTMTCAVPNTQTNKVNIDPRAETLLGTRFTNRDG